MYTKTNGGDSYFLFHALPIFFIKYCHKLCTERQIENFHRKWKNTSCGAQFKVLPNQVSKKSFCTFEDIDLRESHAKLHEKPSETLGAD